MSQCNQCCRTPCECMDGDETEREATTPNPEAIARITPLSHLSQSQLGDLYDKAAAMQHASRLAAYRGFITSRVRARWEIAARGLCFLVRAEFDSRTLSSLGEAP